MEFGKKSDAKKALKLAWKDHRGKGPLSSAELKRAWKSVQSPKKRKARRSVKDSPKRAMKLAWKDHRGKGPLTSAELKRAWAKVSRFGDTVCPLGLEPNPFWPSVGSSQCMKPCGPGQFRSAETARCRSVKEALRAGIRTPQPKGRPPAAAAAAPTIVQYNSKSAGEAAKKYGFTLNDFQALYGPGIPDNWETKMVNSKITVKDVERLAKARGLMGTRAHPVRQTAAVVAAEVADRPLCPPGQFRSLETGRCRRVDLALKPLPGMKYPPALNFLNAVAVEEAKPCPPGQFRSLDTGRCRRVDIALRPPTKTQLSGCSTGFEPNPNPGKGRKNCLKKCANGLVRSTTTGRCVKNKSLVNSGVIPSGGFVLEDKLKEVIQGPGNERLLVESDDEEDVESDGSYTPPPFRFGRSRFGGCSACNKLAIFK